MFPFQLSDELCVKISSDPNQRHRISQNQILSSQCYDATAGYCHEGSCNNLTIYGGEAGLDGGGTPRRKPRGMSSDQGGNGDGHDKMKMKMIHRDVERQRRQDMAMLYATLRTLLPLEFIKGKRSISDQMSEAVNYIKHSQRNIRELSVRRDELKAVSDYSSFCSGNSGHDLQKSSSSCVIVRPCLMGVEILLRGDVRLSRVIEVVLEEEFSVLSCVSARVDDRLIHTIHGQASKSEESGDIQELQRKLTQIMN